MMDVIPVTPENLVKPIPNIRTRTYFVVYAPLDEQLLRSALDRLIRDHWRKLGGRLVSRPGEGGVDYHVPLEFDQRYQLFEWSSGKQARTIGEAFPWVQNPAPEKGVSILPSIRTLEEVCRPSSWPWHKKDECPDAPLLYVHLTYFDNATVIATSLPHVAADQGGLANIVKAWLGLIKGKTPPPMLGYDTDVLATEKPYASYPKNEIVRKGRLRIIHPLAYLLVILGILGELIFFRKELHRTLFVPISVVESHRKRYSKALEAKYGTSPGISTGDVLTAIILKLSRMHDKRPRTVLLSHAATVRNRIPALSGEKAEAYIHNALFYPTSRFPIDSSTPLSEIAYQSRQALKNCMSEEDIDRDLTVIREMARRGQMTHICEPFDRSYNISNWCSVWKDLDFSPAVKAAADGKDNVRPKMLVLGGSGELSMPVRFGSLILSRSEEGFWCEFAAPTTTFELIEEHLAKDPMLDDF
ncbi:hypothetical protein GQ53DRAFT_835516 [Thozetella sp. PMI_491]|nr:hypothetical protein GQ53DRAFT_835516 [Thozetella sp. PMI_491]